MSAQIQKSTQDKVKELLYWKNEFRKVIKEQDSERSSISSNELQKRFLVAEKKLVESEYQLMDIQKGLYMGIGYPLGREMNPKPIPIYAKWKNLNNHVGFKGTTMVGKTQNMLWHIEQCKYLQLIKL